MGDFIGSTAVNNSCKVVNSFTKIVVNNYLDMLAEGVSNNAFWCDYNKKIGLK